MRIDVKKYIFVGLRKDKESFFREAQKRGFIHFKEKKITSQEEVHLFTESIKVLRELPPVDQEEKEYDSYEIAKEILKLRQEIEKLEEEKRVIQLDCERISIFGDFSLADIAYLREKGSLTIQFLGFKKGKAKENADLIFIGSDHGLDYFVSINKKPVSYEGMIEIKIEHPLSDLKKSLTEIDAKKERLEKTLHEYARFNHLLHKALVQALNHAALKEAENGASVALDNSLFTATGWVPEDKKEQFTHFKNIYSEEIAPEPDERAPTYLENRGWGKVGEDVIGIYDTPSTQDKDPSLWVLFGFLVFFSIIIGDGGYGSIYLGLVLYIRYKYPFLTGVKKRLLNLSTLLCIGSVIWGLLSASFFGISLNPENPLQTYSLVTHLAKKKAAYHADLNDKSYQGWVYQYPTIEEEKDPHQIILKGYRDIQGTRSYELLSTLKDEVLLEIALFIGVIHLIIGLIRYSLRTWSHFGWVFFLIGGYLYFPVFLGVPSLMNYVFGIPYLRGGEVGLQMILAGIPLAVILAIIQNGISGLAEIMNLIQVFADVLSYLRLYALGLSGSIMSLTINQLASNLPFVIAIVIIVIGHGINMVLGVMGGVIHGLRLNFLEWYHYSFEGGGRKFKPLEIKEL